MMDRYAIIIDSDSVHYAIPFSIYKRRFELYRIAENEPVQLIFKGKIVTISGNEMKKIKIATKDYKQKLLKKTYYKDKRGPLTLRLQKIINNRAVMNL